MPTVREQVLTMRAYVDENKYLEFEYKLAPDSYMVEFQHQHVQS